MPFQKGVLLVYKLNDLEMDMQTILDQHKSVSHTNLVQLLIDNILQDEYASHSTRVEYLKVLIQYIQKLREEAI